MKLGVVYLGKSGGIFVRGITLPRFSGCLKPMKPCIIRRAGKTGSRRVATRGGKSGLHRAQCQLTAGRGNTTESGAESKTADGATRTGKGEKVR